MEMTNLNKYMMEHWKEYFKTHCRSCYSKADKKLIHKQTKEEYPFCQLCIEKGFYNKEIFDVKVE